MANFSNNFLLEKPHRTHTHTHTHESIERSNNQNHSINNSSSRFSSLTRGNRKTMTPSGTSSEQKPSRLKNSSNTPYKALPPSLPIPREELFHSLAVHYSTCQRSRIYNLAARAKGRKRGKEGGENSMSIPQGEITLLHIGKNFRVRLSLSLSLSLNPGKK